MPDARPVLVTGATGYVGGRLVPRLLEAGYAVRCLARAPRKLADRPWATDPCVDIRGVELCDRDSLVEAMRDCAAAFYLVRSMVSAGDGCASDGDTAKIFAGAAGRAGLARIIYLGGLGELEPGLSRALASRAEVERLLASGPAPVTVLRAAMIIGSGSASFEMLRSLVDRLPVMLTPRWVATECQPIAVRNVLHYLVACLSAPGTVGRTLDIGGPEVLTYRALMTIMAEQLGHRRRIAIPVPVFTPRLSALWIHLVTPISQQIAIPLVGGLRDRAVCRSDEALRLMPQRLLGVRESIRLALDRVEQGDVRTVWSSAGPIPRNPDWSDGTVFTDVRSLDLDVPPPVVFRAVCRLGGANGWCGANWLWWLRGALDRFVGGPGLRRGRRHPEQLSFGEVVDFWRVIGLEPNRVLRLRAEMKLPGDALLEFAIEPQDAHGAPLPRDAAEHAKRTRLTQAARFRPSGLAGLLYWYSVAPFHGIVFSRMLKGIRLAAERMAAEPDPLSDFRA